MGLLNGSGFNIIKGDLQMTKVFKENRRNKFEIKGLWWTPDNPEQIPGILIYEPNKIRLELTGVLGEEELFGKKAPEIICGFSNEGEQFRLFPNLISGNTYSFPGFPTETYDIDEFIAGVFEDGDFLSRDNIIFDSATFYTDKLTSWLNPDVMQKATRIKPELNEDVMTLKYINVPTKAYYIDCINTAISENYTINTNHNGEPNLETTIRTVSSFIFDPDKPQCLDWYLSKITSFKNLLMVLMGEPTKYIDFVLYNKENDKKIKFFNKELTNENKSNKSKSFIVKYKDIEEQFENLVKNWYLKQDSLKIVFELYLSDFYTKSFVETKLLNVIQTLEIYHRKADYIGKHFQDKDFNSYITLLNNFIDSHLPKEASEKFKGKLTHANEYSLSKRLKEIIWDFEDDIIVLLFGSKKNAKKFINKLVDTRNYLTHYDPNNKKNILKDPYDQLSATTIVKVLLSFVFFKELGCNEMFIYSLIKKNISLMNRLFFAKEQLNMLEESLKPKWEDPVF